MRKKIIAILVMMLLAATAVLPLVSSADKNDSSQVSDGVYVDDECGCNEFYETDGKNGGFFIFKKPGKTELPEPLDSKDASPKPTIIDTPDYFSWKDYNGEDWMTPAKDQGICGSCWDFQALGTLESIINIREGCAGLDPDLSEQYVLSCLPIAGNCQGGDDWKAFKYIMSTTSYGNNCNGIIPESCMPYQADDTIPCEDKCPDWEDKLIPISNYGRWFPDGTPEDIEAIKTQVIETGPVSITMMYTEEFMMWGWSHHDPDDYYPYPGSIGEEYHGVIIVGWKDDPSIPNGGYWICKNSFGTLWGYEGFFNIEYRSSGIDSIYLVWVDYDPESFNWPPTTDANGPTSGKLGTKYEFTFNAVDPDGDDVKYHIDWDDGDFETTSFYPSGDDVKLKHTWNSEGTYTIKAKAEDEFGLVGPESTFAINITKKTRAINRPFLNFLQQHPYLFPILQTLLLQRLGL